MFVKLWSKKFDCLTQTNVYFLVCKFPSPFFGIFIILFSVVLVKISNIWHQRIIRIRICQKGTNGQQDFGYGQSWAPLIFQNIQTNASCRTYIWMVNASFEIDVWGFKWILSRKNDVQEKNPFFVNTIFWTHNGCRPFVNIVFVIWSRTAIHWRILLKFQKFFGYSFCRIVHPSFLSFLFYL